MQLQNQISEFQDLSLVSMQYGTNPIVQTISGIEGCGAYKPKADKSGLIKNPKWMVQLGLNPYTYKEKSVFRPDTIYINEETIELAYIPVLWEIRLYYSGGGWETISFPLEYGQLSTIAVGDINGDGLDDIIGNFYTGVYWRDSATGVWTMITNLNPIMIAAGDINGGGKDDLVSLEYVFAGVWVRVIYSEDGSNEWLITGSESFMDSNRQDAKACFMVRQSN